MTNKEIFNNIEALQKKANDLKNNIFASDNPSILEIDLMKDYLRKAYELYSKLAEKPAEKPEIPVIEPVVEKEKPVENVIKKVFEKVVKKPAEPVAPVVEEIKEEIQEEIVPEPEVVEPEPEIVHEVIEEQDVAAIQEPVEEIIPEPEIIKFEAPEPEVVPVKKVEVVAEVKPVTPSAKQSINEIMTARKTDNSLSARFQKTGIKDIKKAIGINERIAMIKDLFKGDSDTFNAVIEQLNSCSNVDAAFVVLAQQIEKYKWDTENPNVLMIIDFVERRFL